MVEPHRTSRGRSSEPPRSSTKPNPIRQETKGGSLKQKENRSTILKPSSSSSSVSTSLESPPGRKLYRRSDAESHNLLLFPHPLSKSQSKTLPPTTISCKFGGDFTGCLVHY